MQTTGKKPTTRLKKAKVSHGRDDPEQSKRFLEAAREAEADETEEGAERAFQLVAKKPVRK